MTDTAVLDSLVPDWLTLPDVAERLGIDVGKVRRLLQEGRLVAVRRGDPTVLSVPADFFVPLHLANPAAPTAAGPDRDGQRAGPSSPRCAARSRCCPTPASTRRESIEWLFSTDEVLGRTPMEALRAGSKSEVRRRAQTLV